MLPFWKMHGLGNDFVIVDARARAFAPNAATIRLMADRRRGLGCDQFIVLRPPATADADIFMQIYNADGTESGACGNATRCVARLLLDETGKTHGTVQTMAGLLPVWRDGALYAVDIAAPRFGWRDIPLAAPQEGARLDLTIGPLSAPVAVNVGNPHAVFFVPDAMAVDLATWGPQVEHHALFPQRVNVEICEILSLYKLRMRVWERGCGITPACGSGAVAALVAAASCGLAARQAEIILDGGMLRVEWRDDNRAILIGGASLVAEGTLAAEICS